MRETKERKRDSERDIYGSFHNIVGLNSKCSDSKSTEREKGGGERDKLEERKRERKKEREREREREIWKFF